MSKILPNVLFVGFVLACDPSGPTLDSTLGIRYEGASPLDSGSVVSVSLSSGSWRKDLSPGSLTPFTQGVFTAEGISIPSNRPLVVDAQITKGGTTVARLSLTFDVQRQY